MTQAVEHGQFRCAWCGGVFEKDWSEEEALAELKAHFGSLKPEECVQVCEDCYQKHHPQKFPHRAEEATAEVLRRRMEKP